MIFPVRPYYLFLVRLVAESSAAAAFACLQQMRGAAPGGASGNLFFGIADRTVAQLVERLLLAQAMTTAKAPLLARYVPLEQRRAALVVGRPWSMTSLVKPAAREKAPPRRRRRGGGGRRWRAGDDDDDDDESSSSSSSSSDNNFDDADDEDDDESDDVVDTHCPCGGATIVTSTNRGWAWCKACCVYVKGGGAFFISLLCENIFKTIII